MQSKNKLVIEISNAIENGKDYTLLVPESLRFVLKSCANAPGGKSEMLTGLKGLPKDSLKLVEMGVFHIDGGYVKVDSDILRAIEKKTNNLESLLVKLKEKARLSAHNL